MTDLNKDLATGKIGTIGKYDVSFVNGKLVFSLSASADGADISVSISIGPKEIADLITAKINNPLLTEAVQFAESTVGVE